MIFFWFCFSVSNDQKYAAGQILFLQVIYVS